MGDGSSLRVHNASGTRAGESTNDAKFRPVGRQSSGVRHEVEVAGLVPSTNYRYHVRCETSDGDVNQSPDATFTTAPKPGEGTVKFAFVSDSREGVGGGERAQMGHNALILRGIGQDAFRRGVAFMLFGGDLVNGYTSDVGDFRMQLRGWKQSLAGFWRTRPVYTVMGNHEALLNVFDDGSKYGIQMDKWPYKTQSAEAVFADCFWNPENAPTQSDPRRPTYRENVYSFQYGPVLCVGYNNNYWWSDERAIPQHGGSPEGYILEDQLAWIERTLQDAESDPTVKYIVLHAQEPVFPCGGHVKDSMWWSGNNGVRAYTLRDGEMVAESMGMVEVRNRFWEAVAGSSKVAVVLSGDEHEYHRTLVDATTPVGVWPDDDTDGDKVLDRYSPNPRFVHPTWHITAGTAGAPYYAREETPWTPTVLTSQHGYCLFEADQQALSVSFYSMTGQLVDHVPDLMAVKRVSPLQSP